MKRGTEKRTGGNDEGYAVVLGAMILLGFGLLAFATYQTTIAPSLVEENEAQVMEVVQDRLSQWTASATQHRAQSSGAGASTGIPLSHASPPLSGPQSSGTLAFEPDRHSIDLHGQGLTLDWLNGTRVGGTGEAWITTDEASVTSVVDIEKLRLRVKEVSAAYSGQSVTLNVTDANGEHAGDLRLSIEGSGDNQGGGGQGYEVVVRTRGESGNVLFDQPILISSTPQSGQSDPISPFWVDVLAQEYQFLDVLEAAQPPFDLRIHQDALDSEYTVVYEKTETPGTQGGGLSIGNYTRSLAGGTLVYEAGGTSEALSVEHGALIRSSQEGAVFVKPPSFSAQLLGHEVSIHLEWPSLDGSRASASGALTILSSSTGSVYALQGQASSFGVNLTTEHPGLWGKHFASQLEEAGLTDGKGFSTAKGDDWARVDVWGIIDPGPGSDAADVRVDVRSIETPIHLD